MQAHASKRLHTLELVGVSVCSSGDHDGDFVESLLGRKKIEFEELFTWWIE